jgi:TatD DNase family protein
VNGIVTFAKDKKEVYTAVPLEKLLLETDAPFLTPVPKRGTVNEPAFTTFVANYISDLHSVSLQELSAATERNATSLFLNK